MNDINNRQDVLDVRDIIARVEELREENPRWVTGVNMPGYMPESEPQGWNNWEDARDALIEELEHFASEDPEDAPYGVACDELRADSQVGGAYGVTIGKFHFWLSQGEPGEGAEELKQLEDLLSQMAGYGGDEEWEGDWYPITLIRDDYFEEYSEQLAEELDLVKPDAQWPYTCIDWEAAAEQLKMDYTSCEFEGVTYWYR